MELIRKYLNYILFGAVVVLVVGLAVNHSRHMRALVDALSSSDKQARSAAAAELIESEQFMDSISGEPVSVRVQAAAALQTLGNDKAVGQAIPMLKDTDKPVRDRAVVTLEAIGGNSPANIAQLVTGLKDGDPYVRKGVVTALTDPVHGIGPRPGVVQAIVKIMKAEGGARGPGGDVLGNPTFVQRGASAESVPLLLTQLGDKDEGVRAGAADALGKIGDPRAVAALQQLVAKDTATVRRVAIGAIALIADPAGEDTLIQAIKDPTADNEARAQAAGGLGRIANPTAIKTLVDGLNDDDLNLRAASVSALAVAARPAPEKPVNPAVLGDLIMALRDPRPNAVLGAAQALRSLGATEVDPALVGLLNPPAAGADSDVAGRIRVAAALALGFHGNSAAVQPLLRALADPDGRVGEAASGALADIGSDATESLIAELRGGGANALYAARALANQGKDALPALERAAQSPNPVSERWAAVALGDLGLAEARPALQQLAASKDPDVAYVANQQLDRIGRTR
jgi:HEAT repeat protein